jgi:hypothetical protein
MMDRSCFLDAICGQEPSLELEVVEHWIDDNVFPQMMEAGKAGKESYEFVVDVWEVNPSIIRKVFHNKGYKTLWWPVVSRSGECATHMRLQVLW